MRIFVTVDEKLYQQALEMADPGMNRPEHLIEEALRAYIRVQAAKRLEIVGGAAPVMKQTPRRRGR